MTKRWVIIIAAVLLVLAVFPATALATERYEILKIGDEDEYVQQLQEKLKELGFFSGRATGYYGTVTQKAVINYQRDAGLAADGKAGPVTLASLMGEDYTIPADRFVNDNDSAEKVYPGERGDEVSRIQTALQQLEYYDYGKITGYYGPVTKNAVLRFQRTNELNEDGIAGPVTLSLLYSDSAKFFCIYPGDRGDDVRALQTRLNELGYYDYSSITGYFGKVTEAALKQFQAQAGLTADAKAGKMTRAALYSKDAAPWDGNDRIGSGQAPPAEEAPKQTPAEKMLAFANAQLGKKYVYSTEGPNTFDCSGFVYYVLKYMGISTSRYSSDGFSKVDKWELISGKDDLLPGDLLFFKSDGSSRIGHTGIYIGNGDFIHASSSGGQVKITPMTSYYDRNFVLARRIY